MCEEDKRGQIRWRSKGLVFADNVAVASQGFTLPCLCDAFS